jgi:hypothetical protein
LPDGGDDDFCASDFKIEGFIRPFSTDGQYDFCACLANDLPPHQLAFNPGHILAIDRDHSSPDFNRPRRRECPVGADDGQNSVVVSNR